MSNVRVLLIEDSDDDALLLEREIRRLEGEIECHRVVTQAQLKEALEASWSLVVSDYNLPDLDVPQVIQMAKASDPHLPVIVVSGNIGEEVTVEVMRAGAKDFLVKDSLRRLLPVIRREIADSAIRRAQVDSEFFMASSAKIMQAIAIGTPLPEVLSDICNLIDTLCPSGKSTVLLMSEDGKRLLRGASPGLPPAYAEMVHDFEIGPDVACCGAAAFRKEEIFSTNLRKDEKWEDFKEVTEVADSPACWSTPLMDNHGRVLGTFAQYINEERMPTEAERRIVSRATEMALVAIQRHRDESALRDSEEMLRSMSDSTRYSILVVDPDCVEVKFMNKRFREVVELEAQGLAEEGLSAIAAIGAIRKIAVDKERFDSFVERFKQGYVDGHIGEDELEGDRHVRWSVAPVLSDDGSLIGRLLAVEDITEHRGLEDRLRQASKLESLGTLAGGIAHDFNNILTPIMGLATLGVSDKRVEAPERKRWQTVLDSSRRARDLIKKILSFSRRGEVKSQSLEIGDMIRSSIQLLKEALPSTISIDADLGGQDFIVEGDYASIEQVFLNIATNAFHAMEDRGGALRVSLNSATGSDLPPHADRRLRRRDFVRIDVKDSGPGIPPEEISRIFDPFYTTKPVGKGTGLGLSQALGIVQAHDGVMHVESSNEGATFSVFFPLSSTDDVPTPMSAEVRPLRQGHGRILVIEDENAVRELYVICLSDAGYQVESASDGAEGLEIAQNDDAGFDLILTDETMPKLKGTEVIRQLRAAGDITPAILCTGVLSTSITLEAETLGVEACLSKPVGIDVLTETVASLLGAPATAST